MDMCVCKFEQPRMPVTREEASWKGRKKKQKGFKTVDGNIEINIYVEVQCSWEGKSKCFIESKLIKVAVWRSNTHCHLPHF